jgi:Predicted solute binding protein
VFYLTNETNVTSISTALYENEVLAVWSYKSSVEYSLFNGTAWSSPRTLINGNILSVKTNGSEILVLCKIFDEYHLLVFRNFSLVDNISLPVTVNYIVTFNSKIIIVSNVSISFSPSLHYPIGYSIGEVYGLYINGSKIFKLKGLGLPVYDNYSEFVLVNFDKYNETIVSIYNICGKQLYNLILNEPLLGVFVQNNIVSISHVSAQGTTICMYYLINGKAIEYNKIEIPSLFKIYSYSESNLVGYVNSTLILENITITSNISKSGICLNITFTPSLMKVYTPSLPCKPEVQIEETEYPGMTVLLINYTEPNYYSHYVSCVEILINGKIVCKISSPSATIPFYIYQNGTYNITVLAVNFLGSEKTCIITTIQVKPNVTVIPKPQITTTTESYPGYTLLNISYDARNVQDLICVQLFINGSLVKKFTTPSGYYIYNITSNGTYLITVKAISKLGSSINSTLERVKVMPLITTSTTTTTSSTMTKISTSTTSSAPPTSNLTIYLGIIGLIIVIALVSLIILRKR